MKIYEVIAKYKQLSILDRKNEIDYQTTPQVKSSDFNSLRDTWKNSTKDIVNQKLGIINGKPMPGSPNLLNTIFVESTKILDPGTNISYKGKKGMVAAIQYQTDRLLDIQNQP
jgi:hypothetical protein